MSFTRKVWIFMPSVIIAAVLLTFVIPKTAMAMNDDELRAYQLKLLDSQVEGSDSPELHTHAAHKHPPVTSGAGLPAKTGGNWANLPPFPETFNAIHSIAGPGGKFLLVAGSGNSRDTFEAGTFKTYVWVPATGERREVVTPEDLFCAGHVLLPDGRALVGGGTTSYSPFKGSKGMYAFNFKTEKYEALPPMAVGRWYPSIINGADGKSLIVAGIDHDGYATGVSEVFDYRTGKTSTLHGQREFPLYPHIFLASNGKYFYSGASSGSTTLSPGFWKPFTDNSYQPVAGMRRVGERGAAASCFVGDVRDQRLMIMGGGSPSTDQTDIIKLNASSPVYTPGPTLRAAKTYLSCVNLPDGTLFEANGGNNGNLISGASGEAGILKAYNGTWEAANPLPAGEHRLYHSMLFLLDDGRVVSITSNPNDTKRSTSVLAYSPPYLHKGTRPVIKSTPTEVNYGKSYTISATATSAKIKNFAITSAPSPTHSSDSNQRYIALKMNGSGKITIPTSRNILPPGWYRIWAVDTQGRVSVARWIHLS